MKTKLTTKDLIAAGAFGAIYLVVLTVLASVTFYKKPEKETM